MRVISSTSPTNSRWGTFLCGVLVFALPMLGWADVDVQSLERSLEGHDYLKHAFHEMLQNHATSSILLNNLRRAEKTTLGGQHPAKVAILGMALDSNTRRVMVETLLAEKIHQSRIYSERARIATQRIIEAEKAGRSDIGAFVDVEAQVGDLVVVGGTGPAGAQLQTTLEQQNARYKVTIVEQQNSIGGTFDSLMFLLNTANKPSRDSEVPEFRVENDNEIIGAILQVPEFDPRAYAVARSLARTLQTILGMSNAIIQFEQTVVEIQDKEKLRGANASWWPARYRSTIVDAQGNIIYRFDNAAADAGGIGSPNIPVKSVESAKFINDQFDGFAADPTSDIRVLNFGLASKRIDALDHPMLPYVGKKILVVGDSVASRDFILWLMRRGPDESYKDSFAQEGRYAEIVWVGVDQTTIEEWVAKNRLFYSVIAAAIKNKSLTFTGKTYMSNLLPSFNEDGTIQSVTVETDYAGRGKELFKGDVAFLGTGYRRDDRLYKGLVDPSQLVDTNGKPVRLSMSRAVVEVAAPGDEVINAAGGAKGLVAIAKQIVGQFVYLLGAGAGLVKPGEVPDSPGGSPLMKDNLPRIKAWVKRVFTKVITPGDFRRIEAPLHQAIPAGVTDRILERRHKKASLRRNVAGADEIYMRARLRSAFLAIDQGASVRRDVRVTIDLIGPGQFKISTDAKNDRGSLAAGLTAELRSDPTFVEIVAANIGTESSGVRTPDQIEFEVASRSDGSHDVIGVEFNRRGLGFPKPVTPAVEQKRHVDPTFKERVEEDLRAGRSVREVFTKHFTENNGWKDPDRGGSSGYGKNESIKDLDVALLTYDDEIYVGHVENVSPHEDESMARTYYVYTLRRRDGSIETLKSDNVSQVKINISGQPTKDEFDQRYKDWVKPGPSYATEMHDLKNQRVALFVTRKDKHDMSAIVEGTVVGFLDRSRRPIQFADELAERYYTDSYGTLLVRIADATALDRCQWLLTQKRAPSDDVVAFDRFHLAEVRVPSHKQHKAITENEFTTRYSTWHPVQIYSLGGHSSHAKRKVALLIKRGTNHARTFESLEGTFLGKATASVPLSNSSDGQTPEKSVEYAQILTAHGGTRKIPIEDLEQVRIDPEAVIQRVKW